jgi:hypothetical protein
MLEQVFTSTKLLPGYYNTNAMYLRFMKTWRALYYTFLNAAGTDTSLYKLLHDASTFKMSNNVKPGTWILGLAGGGVGTYGDSSPAEYVDKVFPVDEFTGFPLRQKGVSYSGTVLNWRSLVDLERDYAMTPYNGNVLRASKLSDGSVAWDFTHNLGGSQNTQYVHWVRDGQGVILQSDTGKVLFFNYLTQEVLLQTAVDPFLLAAYDSANQVIVTINTDLLVRVYAITPLPDHFIGPTLSPASPYQYGHADLSVQLVGDQGEPCAGWWIHWNLTNNKGALEKIVSQTGEDGIATNYYFCPTDAGDIGAETVSVEVAV